MKSTKSTKGVFNRKIILFLLSLDTTKSESCIIITNEKVIFKDTEKMDPDPIFKSMQKSEWEIIENLFESLPCNWMWYHEEIQMSFR